MWHKFMAILMLPLAAQAQTGGCNTPSASPSVTVEVPSAPFAVAVAPDGCHVFASQQRGPLQKAGIAVFERGGGHLKLSRVVTLPSQAALGLALSHDGKLLVVAGAGEVVFLDVARAASGAANPVLGSMKEDGSGASDIYVNITADDKLLFVSDERRRAIGVIDLARARANGYKADAFLGKIPVGNLPIALTFSADGKWLYTTSEMALADWNWPKACKPEGRGAATAGLAYPEGAVIVVDVARARTDPAQSVVGRIPAGCSAVRMAISPAGDRIYVTARNSDAVLAFDTGKLLSDPDHARLGMVAVGTAPVPVAVIAGGKKVVVGNSNRFAGAGEPSTLTVLDSAKFHDGDTARLGTIPAGGFPREMAVSADGHTLFVTNFGSKSLQMIDVEHLPIVPEGKR
jgi:DNA-binding beta-propeller fold protein YncE